MVAVDAADALAAQLRDAGFEDVVTQQFCFTAIRG